MARDKNKFTGHRIRPKNTKIRDHCRKILARDSRYEIDALHERAARVLRYDDYFLRQPRHFRRAAGAGEPDLWMRICAGHRRIEIAEAVELRCSKKSHIDAPALQPVAEELRHWHHDIRRFRQFGVGDRQRGRGGLRTYGPGFVHENDVGSIQQASQTRSHTRRADADEALRAIPELSRSDNRHDSIARPLLLSNA